MIMLEAEDFFNDRIKICLSIMYTSSHLYIRAPVPAMVDVGKEKHEKRNWSYFNIIFYRILGFGAMRFVDSGGNGNSWSNINFRREKE